jgi:hypothetical protein
MRISPPKAKYEKLLLYILPHPGIAIMKRFRAHGWNSCLPEHNFDAAIVIVFNCTQGGPYDLKAKKYDLPLVQ